MQTDDRPVGDDEFAALFDADPAELTALAVSGGADSLALFHLADSWSRRMEPRGRLLVLTVDHGLRAASSSEAAMVAAIAAERGIEHRTLVWAGEKPATGIEASAREARYRLVSDAMRAAGARLLATAHHADDQAETVLMRLARGSGLTGLAGMAPRTKLGEIVLLRPLLTVPKSRLVATAHAAGLVPATDETNSDPRFARARLRRIAPLLASEGIDATALGRMAGLVRRADAALSAAASGFLAEHASVDPLAVVRIWHGTLWQQPEEIRLRVIARIIGAVGTGGPAPSAAQLAALDAVIGSTKPFRRTLGGAIVRTKGHELLFYREPGRGAGVGTDARDSLAGTALRAGGTWDRRFHVDLPHDHQGLTIGPLGEAGYAELPAALRPRPKAVALTQPAFRRFGRLVAVPSVGFVAAGGEGISAYTVLKLSGEPAGRIPTVPLRPGFLLNRE